MRLKCRRAAAAAAKRQGSSNVPGTIKMSTVRILDSAPLMESRYRMDIFFRAVPRARYAYYDAACSVVDLLHTSSQTEHILILAMDVCVYRQFLMFNYTALS